MRSRPIRVTSVQQLFCFRYMALSGDCFCFLGRICKRLLKRGRSLEHAYRVCQPKGGEHRFSGPKRQHRWTRRSLPFPIKTDVKFLLFRQLYSVIRLSAGNRFEDKCNGSHLRPLNSELKNSTYVTNPPFLPRAGGPLNVVARSRDRHRSLRLPFRGAMIASNPPVPRLPR
jgi:hypothetical protein